MMGNIVQVWLKNMNCRGLAINYMDNSRQFFFFAGWQPTYQSQAGSLRTMVPAVH